MQTVLPGMRAQKSGVIVNISSAAGLNPRPSMAIYGASKWALEGLSQGLAQEVAPFGIRVLIVQPGSFSTNIFNAVNTTAKPLTEDYRATQVGAYFKMFEGEKRTFPTPNDVDKGCQGIFEAVTGTKRGEGKEKFLRLPLSSDAALRTREQIASLQSGHDEWRAIWESTGHDSAAMNVTSPEK
jgi:NAD(P)-dependent dehydrogenase (short-subunit alcohol dehydrogenase family)